MMIRAIVTDIEGTTTSLSFVKEVLLPCSKKQMEGFVHPAFGHGGALTFSAGSKGVSRSAVKNGVTAPSALALLYKNSNCAMQVEAPHACRAGAE